MAICITMGMGSGGSCFDSNFCGEINDLLQHSVPVLPCSFTLHIITAFRFNNIITNYQLKKTTILGQSLNLLIYRRTVAQIRFFYTQS